MHQTRKYFSHDSLVSVVYEALKEKVKRKYKERPAKVSQVLDAAMSALAMFTLKCQSLLQFDQLYRNEGDPRNANIKALFHVKQVYSDTHMREMLDEESPEIIGLVFKKLFALLQRGGVLREHFLFLDHYLVSLDGTGYFSSHTSHCDHCCRKEHKDGSITYYHQMLAGAVVCPGQEVALPIITPEPIMKTDGHIKNDCERNAAKRWIPRLRRDHPHLPVIIVADGLSSNAPFIELLKEHDCRFILVCQESDHKYLTEWVNAADAKEAPIIEESSDKKTIKYQYMRDVPLNDSNAEVLVNVVKMWEVDHKKNRTSKWMWITDLHVTEKRVKEIAKAGRARWKIENETFNTLKNQGYQFEHNFGHGYKNLNTMLACILMTAFLIDQCLQKLNVRFQAAYAKCKAKYTLWEGMRSVFEHCYLPSLEMIYELIACPARRIIDLRQKPAPPG